MVSPTARWHGQFLILTLVAGCLPPLPMADAGPDTHGFPDTSTDGLAPEVASADHPAPRDLAPDHGDADVTVVALDATDAPADGSTPRDADVTEASAPDIAPTGGPWVRSPAASRDGVAPRVAVDAANNWYVTGFDRELVVIASLGPEGEARWRRSFPRGTSLSPPQLALDGRGNVYVSHGFEATLDLGGGPVTPTHPAGDVLLVSYTGGGALRWARAARPLGVGWIKQMAGAPEGVVLVGRPVGGSDIVSYEDGQDLVMSLSDAGVVRWSRSARGNKVLAVGADGDVVIAGSAYGAADWGGGVIPARSMLDLFVTRWSPAGAHRWSRRFGEPGAPATAVAPRAVALDAEGNAYVTGDFVGALDFGGGAITAPTERGFVASLGRDGLRRWERLAARDTDRRRGVSVASDGSVVTVGSEERADLSMMIPAARSDAWVAFAEGFDRASGTLRWRREFVSRWPLYGEAAASDARGGTLFAGRFEGPTDFGVATPTVVLRSNVFARYLHASELAPSCTAPSVPCAGACVDTRTDPAHCGACGRACVGPGRSCVAGTCALGPCPPATDDCDRAPANGCEADLNGASAHCGACGRACAPGAACVNGQCCVGAACEGVPFVSDGREGAFAPTADVVLTPGVHQFTTITIPAGVTVRTSGAGLLELRASGDVVVQGVIDLSGGEGGRARSTAPGALTSVGGVGGATGHPGRASDPGSQGGGLGGGVVSANKVGLSTAAGTGGGGVAGGGAASPATGGANVVAPESPASLGSGVDGGAGATCRRASCGGFRFLWTCSAARGGRGGGLPYNGLDGAVTATCSADSPVETTGGGGSIGATAAADLAMRTTFGVGSGGGGGRPGTSFAEEGGGGGGGGGGALRITTPTAIRLSATARLLANGGRPGPSAGGGSGGAIDLRAPTVSAAIGAVVSALGGSPGASAPTSSAGGLGRVRVSVDNVTAGRCVLAGTFNPPLGRGCADLSAPGYVYVTRYPR